MADEKTLISVGRQFGSGGRQVADALGEKLGLRVYDNELISQAAAESGFSEHLLAKSDEKRRIFSISNFLTSGRFGVPDNYLGDNGMFMIQSQVIKNIAEKESAIFIGRCSDYILRNSDCLSVFISAPMLNRVRRVSERMGLSELEAENLILKKDKSRENYYNYFTFRSWGKADNYHICLDSSVLGIDGTADAIIRFLKARDKE